MTHAGPAPRPERLAEIDIVRGIILALMALDHTRSFFFGLAPSPTDLAETTPALFATRWVTHLCAPGFLLLAGLSAALKARELPGPDLSRYLALRGALLVALELTVVTFGWIPDPTRSLVLLQVIWAIGWSMILMAALIRLSRPLVLAATAGLVGLAAAGSLASGPVLPGPPEIDLLLLTGGGRIVWGDGDVLFVSYAVLPWTAVMALGVALAPALDATPRRRAARLLAIGLAAIAGFAALRLAGLGDPVPWAGGADARSALAFFNAEKYPPSPAFLLMTLGPVLLLLALFALRPLGAAARWLATLGRAPLFFYVLHLYALRAAGLLAAAVVWGPDALGPPPKPSTPEWPLSVVWGVWIVAMAALFWPTRWFARIKAARRGGWTSYL